MKSIILYLLFSIQPDTSAAVRSVVSVPEILLHRAEALWVEDRSSIKKALASKITSHVPLIVHVFVPLCDNLNQGIVPVNSKLGDGMNLSTNLYWGAGYGVRSYFKLKTDWKLSLQQANPDSNILERVVFRKTMSNGTAIIMIADAYRGDRMKQCLRSYMHSLAGILNDSISLSDKQYPFHSGADLLIFNGHNGLMDDTLAPVLNADKRPKDAMIIACYSTSYFRPYLQRSGGYPLVTTTGLLAPEAYVIHAAIENWALQKSEKEIRIAAGDAYYAKHPSSTQGGCRGLFRTGWAD